MGFTFVRNILLLGKKYIKLKGPKHLYIPFIADWSKNSFIFLVPKIWKNEYQKDVFIQMNRMAHTISNIPVDKRVKKERKNETKQTNTVMCAMCIHVLVSVVSIRL